MLFQCLLSAETAKNSVFIKRLDGSCSKLKAKNNEKFTVSKRLVMITEPFP